MKTNHLIWGTMLLLLLTVSACKADSGASAEPGASDKAAAEKEHGETGHDHSKMKLTAEGQKFEPPIKVEEVPDGAWYCDMGTVHYARSEKGDGTCPLCKMALKEKAAKK